MKLGVFSPYGFLHKESGLLYLVANFLQKSGMEVSQLRCDGAVPACSRDRKGGAIRSPFQCTQCLNEQRAFAEWSSVRMRDLSANVVPDDVRKTVEWLTSVPTTALGRVEFRGTNLWQVCAPEFRGRWGDTDLEVDSLSGSQEADLRALYTSFVRVAVASERYLAATKPSMVFIAASHNLLAGAFLSEVQRVGVDAAIFTHEPAHDVVSVTFTPTENRYETELVLEGITQMRSDPRTWSPEITSTIHEILTMLGCAPDRVL